jgi:hypothetical protein
MYKDSVRNSQKTHYVSATKSNGLTLFIVTTGFKELKLTMNICIPHLTCTQKVTEFNLDRGTGCPDWRSSSISPVPSGKFRSSASN